MSTIMVILLVAVIANLKTAENHEALLSSRTNDNSPSEQQRQSTFFQALGGMGELSSEDGVELHSKQRKMRATEKFRELESQSLLNSAQEEDQQANDLVLHAKSLAQQILRKQAMAKIRKWIAAKQKAELKKDLQHAASRETKKIPVKHVVDGSHARQHHQEHRRTIVTRPNEHSTNHLSLRMNMKTTNVNAVQSRDAREQQLSRSFSLRVPNYKNEYKQWEFSKLRRYAREHDMYTPSDFCNSDSVIRSVSRTQLKQFFGKSWQSVPYDLQSLAAITACLKQLGLEASKDDGFSHGPLHGKSTIIADCAKGDDKVSYAMRKIPNAVMADSICKACSKLAADPHALSEMKKLLPAAHQHA
eukprot:749121-Hanusia_phi.AAC.1